MSTITHDDIVRLARIADGPIATTVTASDIIVYRFEISGCKWKCQSSRDINGLYGFFIEESREIEFLEAICNKS